MIQWRPLWEHGGEDLLAAYAIRAADARTGGVEPVDIDPDRHMANVPLIPRNASLPLLGKRNRKGVLNQRVVHVGCSYIHVSAAFKEQRTDDLKIIDQVKAKPKEAHGYLATEITVSGNPEKRVHGAAAEGARLEPRITKRPRRTQKRWVSHRSRNQRIKSPSKNVDEKKQWRMMKPHAMLSNKEHAHSKR